MILKLMKSRTDQKGRGSTEETFFDGFDYLTTKVQPLAETESPNACYPSSWFTDEKTENVLVLWLMREDKDIVRYVVIDSSYSVYLMSNEGKTIERIN